MAEDIIKNYIAIVGSEQDLAYKGAYRNAAQ
jgi:hypothetical protein